MKIKTRHWNGNLLKFDYLPKYEMQHSSISKVILVGLTNDFDTF